MTRVTLDLLVMAHPIRAKQARRLAATINAGLVLDPRPAGKPSAYRTSLAAWSMPTRRTHRILIQDDAVLCPGFVKTARRILQARPDSLVAFYVGSAHPGGYTYQRSARRCARYSDLPVDHFVPTVALAMPMRLARQYTEWAAVHIAADYPWDDEALRQWRQDDPSIPAIATIPCLVQHDSTISSVMQHMHGVRQAACWIGQVDPLSLDW